MTPEDVTEPCPRCNRNRCSKVDVTEMKLGIRHVRLEYWHDRHDHHIYVRPGMPLVETVNSELRARAA